MRAKVVLQQQTPRQDSEGLRQLHLIHLRRDIHRATGTQRLFELRATVLSSGTNEGQRITFGRTKNFARTQVGLQGGEVGQPVTPATIIVA